MCNEENVGIHKTRICAEWLEARGFQPIICERPFDSKTKVSKGEPTIACCGFDVAEPRRILEGAGFRLIVECALGGDTSRFDKIVLHTFPDARRKPDEIWTFSTELPLDPQLVEALKQEGDCGIIAESLARKAISSSFVGAVAGALVASEIIRALHEGQRFELVQTQLRHNQAPSVVSNSENYQLRVAANGSCLARRPHKLAA
jgi:hypothetical protein